MPRETARAEVEPISFDHQHINTSTSCGGLGHPATTQIYDMRIGNICLNKDARLACKCVSSIVGSDILVCNVLFSVPYQLHTPQQDSLGRSEHQDGDTTSFRKISEQVHLARPLPSQATLSYFAYVHRTSILRTLCA